MTQTPGSNQAKYPTSKTEQPTSWQELFKFPEGGKEGSLGFEWKYFGTYTGPQNKLDNYDYKTTQEESFWHTAVPGDFTFKLDDLASVLYNSQGNYAGWHCEGVATASITLDASYGNLPLYYHLVKQTFINGDVTANGKHIQNGNVTINGDETVSGKVNVGGKVTAGSFQGPINVQSWKGFDISHPKKEGYRLRHICVEGPEAAVYYRGTMKDTNLINLPEYWDGLVDIDKITVQLTPMGVWQDLYVEQIKWGKQVIVKSASGGPVNAYYTIMAPRLGELHVEYEGESASDYPGDQSEHSICGYHYDKR
jgi:hypothetical protein